MRSGSAILLASLALCGAPATLVAEPRPIETTVRIGFAHFDAPADCGYCAAMSSPGLEAALAYPMSADLELRAQAWWYQSSLEGRLAALGFGLGTRSRPWSARVTLSGQWSWLHNADGGDGDSESLLLAGEGAVQTGRAGRFATELAVRAGWAFADSGAALLAASYGVAW